MINQILNSLCNSLCCSHNMKDEKNHITILLGAGFSANQGYPVGDKLNELLLNCKDEDLSFYTDGSLIPAVNGQKPDLGWKNSYDLAFDFCREMIAHFNQIKGYFDYEKFYDYISEEAKQDKNVKKIAKKYKLIKESSINNQLREAIHVLNQLVSFYLKDNDGNQFYDNAAHYCKPIFPRYTGILNCLETLGNEYIVHVFTLNHDLFFERLNSTDWIRGRLSDGFEELGSPYYGEVKTRDSTYKVRLEHYTGNYNTPFRLYKLHGSMNYAVFHSPVGSSSSYVAPENYLKIKRAVNIHQLYKEIKISGKLTYYRDNINFYADFLTGTSSKIERYNEPLLYQKLFEHFRSNLQNSENLIIIGYGGKDTEINKMILEHFDYKNKPSYIIDPYPGDKINELKDKLNSRLVTKDLETIEIGDIFPN